MHTNRIVTGIGSGALHDFRWALSTGISSYMVSPVAIFGETVAATATSLRDGSARAVLIDGDDIVCELETGTFVVAGAPQSLVVGSVGFGQGAFLLSLSGERHALEVPKGATCVDIDCVNSAGDVGGSIEVRGEECAVVWRNGEPDVLPHVRRVTAIGEDGVAFGQNREGAPVRLSDGAEFGGRGTAVAVNGNGDALVNADESVLIWRADGGVEALAIRGYVRTSALGWSTAGVVLGFGVSEQGAIQHWIFDDRLGLRVLTNQVLEGELTVCDVSAIGAGGELAGTAADGAERFLVRLY